jgi:hypothetical protein
MDETMMNLWIDWVLIPWKNVMHPVILQFLVLNAYQVYMMGSIVTSTAHSQLMRVFVPTSQCWSEPSNQNPMTEQWED